MARTTVETINFTEADNTAPPTGFDDLCNGVGIVEVLSNQFHTPYGFPADARSQNTGYTDDQGASVVISALGTGSNGDEIGVIARASADLDPNRDLYRAYLRQTATNILVLERVLNNTITSLGTSTSATWAVNDTVEIECQGTSIRALRNGTALISVTDSNLTTGRPGIYAKVGANDNLRGDTFVGFNVTAGGSAALGGSAATGSSGTQSPGTSIGL